jgi:hypothetical protein
MMESCRTAPSLASPCGPGVIDFVPTRSACPAADVAAHPVCAGRNWLVWPECRSTIWCGWSRAGPATHPRRCSRHSWELILANPLWQALFGEPERPAGRERNLIWRYFTDEHSSVARTSEEHERFARTMVSDLHDAAARYADDRELRAMIADLRARSDRFAELWNAYTVTRQVADRKTILSPVVGPVTVDCDILTAPDTDLRIVVYTARPGSEDASKLDLLRVAGLQRI